MDIIIIGQKVRCIKDYPTTAIRMTPGQQHAANYEVTIKAGSTGTITLVDLQGEFHIRWDKDGTETHDIYCSDVLEYLKIGNTDTIRIRLSDVKAVNKQYFAPGNAEFFGDIWYRIRKGKSGKNYLLRKTSMWSDMFGEPKTYVYRINPIEISLKVGELIGDIFRTEQEVDTWLSNN